jgi:hypothetical protein
LSKASAVLAWPAGDAWFGKEFVEHLTKGTFILDAGIGSILPSGIEEAHQRGCFLLRVNIWPALTGALSAAHESLLESRNALGWDTIDDVPVVAGGAMGRSGDVIVDSVKHPTRIIGVCDGQGNVRFRFNQAEIERVRKVQAEINRLRVTPQTMGTSAD